MLLDESRQLPPGVAADLRHVANKDALFLTLQLAIVKADQGVLNPLVATDFIVKYKTAIAVAISEEGNQLCTDEKLLYLINGVEVFFIQARLHDGFHSPIMNKRGVSVLVQSHFILESTELFSAISCWTRLALYSDPNNLVQYNSSLGVVNT